MNEIELKKLWQTTNEKLEQSFVVSKKNTADITHIKVHYFLNSMKPVKVFAILTGLFWVGAGTVFLTPIYINSFSTVNKFFLFSATGQVLITAIALFIYIYQLIRIYQVDITNPILKTQTELIQLRISTLWSARISFLQLPLWTTFWWNSGMFVNWTFFQWSISLFAALLFTGVALWLFFNITYENRNSKWFKLMFNGKEWTPLLKSMELLEQIDNYKTEAI